MTPESTLFIGQEDLRDSRVFERVFRLYYPQLTLFANRFLNDLDLSQEVVSDTFTYLWERREFLDSIGSLKSYLYKTVQNRCLNYLKHRKIESEYVNYLLRNGLTQHATESFLSAYDEKDLRLHIHRAIENLPEKCKAVFKLSRYSHLKNREIAESLNISQKTVERQITIALEKLRNSLKHHLLLLLLLFLTALSFF